MQSVGTLFPKAPRKVRKVPGVGKKRSGTKTSAIGLRVCDATHQDPKVLEQFLQNTTYQVRFGARLRNKYNSPLVVDCFGSGAGASTSATRLGGMTIAQFVKIGANRVFCRRKRQFAVTPPIVSLSPLEAVQQI